MNAVTMAKADTAADRLQSLDWGRIGESLLDRGFATFPLLSADECAAARALYDHENGFRKHVIMARHAYGRGEYKYFSYPLPQMVDSLRHALYARLAPVANLWSNRLGKGLTFPAALSDFTAQCHADGQLRPTPLLLKYGPGDYNRLHQDLYGDRFFPFQVATLLNAPGRDFEGGEFVLVENRPRVQARPMVVPLKEGEAIVFAVNERPDMGSRGWRRASLRHGVSDILAGERHTMGIIFHDAR
ncbi:MAG: proline hydroxylase [Alphaproteobacteria bacterium]|nr:MAG: proline hydroxylase [Alphaproteobacteria bacterium]